MINLECLPAEEAERLAYAEGFTGTAALFARIDELETLLSEALDAVEYYDRRNGCPELLQRMREVLR